jgi:hypothetical protein
MCDGHAKYISCRFLSISVVRESLIAGLSGSSRLAGFGAPAMPFFGSQTAAALAFQRGGKGAAFLGVEKP